MSIVSKFLRTGDFAAFAHDVDAWAQTQAHDPALVPVVALAERAVRTALADLIAIGDRALTAEVAAASVVIENAVSHAFGSVAPDGGAASRAAVAAMANALRAAIDTKAAEAISQLTRE